MTEVVVLAGLFVELEVELYTELVAFALVVGMILVEVVLFWKPSDEVALVEIVELVVVLFAVGAAIYIFNRFPAPQYSLEFATQVIEQSAAGSITDPVLITFPQ